MRQSSEKQLDRELKEKWIEGLKSDKYIKIKTYLSDNGSNVRCCSLGVLLVEAGYSFVNVETVTKGDEKCNAWQKLNDLGLEPHIVHDIWSMNDGCSETE